jgi:hypothetical protein
MIHASMLLSTDMSAAAVVAAQAVATEAVLPWPDQSLQKCV